MTNTRGYTYLLTNGTHCKIGITTKTVTSRIAELQTGSPTKIEISGYSYNSNALHMEEYLHNMFAAKRLMGEWFDLSDEDVAIIHKYFEENYLDEYYAPLSENGILAEKELQKRIHRIRILEAKHFVKYNRYFVNVWLHKIHHRFDGKAVSLKWALEQNKDCNEAELLESIDYRKNLLKEYKEEVSKKASR